MQTGRFKVAIILKNTEKKKVKGAAIVTVEAVLQAVMVKRGRT